MGETAGWSGEQFEFAKHKKRLLKNFENQKKEFCLCPRSILSRQEVNQSI